MPRHTHRRRPPHGARWLLVAAASIGSGCFTEPVVIDADDDDQLATGTTGPGGATTLPAESSGTTVTPTPGTTTAETTVGSTTTGLDGTTTSEESTDSSSGDGATTTGGCEPDPLYTQIYWAADAGVIAPMDLITAIFLPDMPLMARSLQANAGTVTFDLELPCPTTATLHLLVWDAVEGISPDNPDSYTVDFDGDEWDWLYGCKTMGQGDESWAWHVLDGPTGAEPCSLTPATFELPAGTHQLTLGNLESGAGIDFAAIAAVVITNDPALDPTTLYQPNP